MSISNLLDCFVVFFKHQFLHFKLPLFFLNTSFILLTSTVFLNTCFYTLNFHSCLHIGHCWFICWACWSHFSIQWIWKQWEHSPQTRGQSSPEITIFCGLKHDSWKKKFKKKKKDFWVGSRLWAFFLKNFLTPVLYFKHQFLHFKLPLMSIHLLSFLHF